MNWLLKFFPGGWMIYAGVAAVAFALGGSAAWTWQGNKLTAVKSEYKSFVTQTETFGEAAKLEAKRQESRDTINKQRIDDETKSTLAAVTADNKRLRDERASRRYVPEASPAAKRPDLACFDRTELESALQRFDKDITGLVDEGTEATVNLNVAKRWAQDR